MQTLHPLWSKRQLECCLYWQGSVRKFLRQHCDAWMEEHRKDHTRLNLVMTECPEAMGMDVTATMLNVGVKLEWPPKNIVRKIYFVGVKR